MVRFLSDIMTSDLNQAKKPAKTRKDIIKILEKENEKSYQLLLRWEDGIADLDQLLKSV